VKRENVNISFRHTKLAFFTMPMIIERHSLSQVKFEVLTWNVKWSWFLMNSRIFMEKKWKSIFVLSHLNVRF